MLKLNNRSSVSILVKSNYIIGKRLYQKMKNEKFVNTVLKCDMRFVHRINRTKLCYGSEK